MWHFVSKLIKHGFVLLDSSLRLSNLRTANHNVMHAVW